MSHPADTRDWIRVLAQYREPSLARSLWVVTNTLVPFFAIWAVAWWALDISYWISFACAIVLGFFLMRIFCIQHDCGHGALFKSKRANDWLGRFVSILTITPYAVWRKMHAVHHETHGNLDRREMGDVRTLTVEEYYARGPAGRALYRFYRNPLFLFGLAPFILFFLQYRLPVGLWHDRKYWISAMGLNAILAVLLSAMYAAGGWAPILIIFVPSVLLGALAGVWTFYVQHQFEDTAWSRPPDWQVHDAALYGSSYVALPRWFAWFTANIGIHHVHHLYARIPFYRLPEVIADHPVFAETNRMSFMDSLKCANFHLWDERQQKILSFREAHRTYGTGSMAVVPAE